MPEQKSLNKNTIALICRTTAKEKKPSFLLLKKRESLPKDMAAKGVSRHEMQTVSTKFIGH